MIDIDIDLVRQHLKVDADDAEDELIEQYIESAVAICEGYCNRKFYQDAEALAEDRSGAKTELVQAKSARDAELEDTEDCDVQRMIRDAWISTRAAILARYNGVVQDANIVAAILLVIGRLYRVRQDVAAGQNATAVQIPEGARRILEPYVWIGDLGGGS